MRRGRFRTGAQTFPELAGVSSPGRVDEQRHGQGEPAQDGDHRASGARRRKTSEARPAPARPAWPRPAGRVGGHQDAPPSVGRCPAARKTTAMSTSSARRLCRAHSRTPWNSGYASRAAGHDPRNQRTGRTYESCIPAARGRPFVGPGPYRLPCRGGTRSAAMGTCRHSSPSRRPRTPARPLRDRPGRLDGDVPYPAPVRAGPGPRQLRDPRAGRSMSPSRCRLAQSRRDRHGQLPHRNPMRNQPVPSARFLARGRYPVILQLGTSPGRPGPRGHAHRARGAPGRSALSVTPGDRARGAFTARAHGAIDRHEFGMTASRGLAGRYLDVTVEVRCVRSETEGRGHA